MTSHAGTRSSGSGIKARGVPLPHSPLAGKVRGRGRYDGFTVEERARWNQTPRGNDVQSTRLEDCSTSLRHRPT